ncbi:NADH dehydrogenase [ubiquinone] 1 beta subcomplex subunit 4 [Dermacentor silvarum]|uniref:NADH dehydrogenase [ubiquinone] 1 beta subcomplex subunit 4 n=1 Tax=Dermacentor silvarum TaxID=543639 RepID=UPI00189ABC72|nr:NADH dehydrogenase [ubiquinone] 1 beta subcomplex subunit 4 [Dermacentor silvarum]
MAYRQPSSIRVETELSHEEKRLIGERAKLKAQLRQEYLRQLTDPHKHGSGGTLFDSQMMRYQAARSNSMIYEHFRPTPKGGLQWFAASILPMLVLGYVVHKDRQEFERRCRTGEIAYKDRMFKMI